MLDFRPFKILIKHIRKFIYLIGVTPKLGLANVGFIIWYRFSLKYGLRKLMFPITIFKQSEPFFRPTNSIQNYPTKWKSKLKKRTDQLLDGNLVWFFKHQFSVGNPPNWFINPFTGDELKRNDIHWTSMGDFDLNTGDVKILWEPSRFDWVTDLVRAYRVFGEQKYLDTLNSWLSDWMLKNPVNQGVNWKCGQEVSIRTMKLMTSLHILQQWDYPSQTILNALHHHLIRIARNSRYAIAQKNNHGTSEAAAMYIVGNYLYNNTGKKKYLNISFSGRAMFENLILTLVDTDGTFSQESVTYHRVACDTVSWVLWAEELMLLKTFNINVQQKFQKLLEWQFSFTISETGDMPNIGSNDGSMFENLHDNGYRDFRPSSQLLCYALNKSLLYNSRGSWHEPVFWRYGKINVSDYYKIKLARGRVLDRSFALLQNNKALVVVKIPNNRFRPANNPFHVDLWVNGKNILGGSGSYSYNHHSTSYFKSIASCNTVQFGQNEPMPKLSRFLNGSWIKADQNKLVINQDGSVSWYGNYKDYLGNSHKRSIVLKLDELEILDSCIGLNNAKIRWHVPNWLEKEEKIKLEINRPYKLTNSMRSLYYLHQEENKTIEVSDFSEAVTRIKF